MIDLSSGDRQFAAQRSNDAFVAAWSWFARAVAGERQEHPGVIATFCNTPVALMNEFFLSSPVADEAELRQRLATVRALSDEVRAPWMFALCEDLVHLDGTVIADTIAQGGLVAHTRVFGMETSLLAPARYPAPKLELRLARDPMTRADLADLNSNAYGLPVADGRAAFGHPAFFGPDSYGVVGYREGRAVATATTLVIDDMLYTVFVATAAEHRKQGFAEAVLRHSVEQASLASGRTRLVLHATEAGAPLYRAMGYLDTARFAMLGKGS